MISNGWSVEADEDRVSVIDPAGELLSVRWSNLGRLVIETNDEGTFTEDVWWLLLADGDRLALRFPQSADGADTVIATLMKLPGFDYESMITALGSVDQGFFPVWRRA